MLVGAAYMNATPDGRIDETTDENDSSFQGIDLEDKNILELDIVSPSEKHQRQ